MKYREASTAITHAAQVTRGNMDDVLDVLEKSKTKAWISIQQTHRGNERTYHLYAPGIRKNIKPGQWIVTTRRKPYLLILDDKDFQTRFLQAEPSSFPAF